MDIDTPDMQLLEAFCTANAGLVGRYTAGDMCARYNGWLPAGIRQQRALRPKQWAALAKHCKHIHRIRIVTCAQKGYSAMADAMVHIVGPDEMFNKTTQHRYMYAIRIAQPVMAI